MRLLTLLLIGLGFRLWQMDLTHYDFEQMGFIRNTGDFLSTARFPLTTGLGFTVGIREPPLYTYLIAVPMLLSRDPAWVTSFQACLDALGAIFLYLVGRDLGGRAAGFAAGLFYAVSPPAIVYSRMAWNPDLIPLFASVGLWGVMGFARRGDSRRLAAGMFAIGCATELHFSVGALFLLVAAAAAGRRKDVRWRPLALAVGALALTIAPYIVLQLSSDWSDFRGIGIFLGSPRSFRPESIYVALSVGGGNFHRAVQNWWPEPDWSLLQDPAFWLVTGLMAFGGLIALRRRGGWVLLLWLLLPVLASLRNNGLVFPHYMLPLVPASAALAGLGLGTLPGRVVLAPLVGLTILVLRGADYVSFQRDAAELNLGALYGIPLRYQQEAAQLATMVPHQGPLFVGGAGIRCFVLLHLLGDPPDTRPFDSSNTLVLNPSGGAYLTEAAGPVGETLARHVGPAETVVRTPDGKPVYFLFVPSPATLATFRSNPTAVHLEADIGHVLRLWGYEQGPFTAGRSTWTTFAWDVTNPGYGDWPHVRLYTHLVDDGGRQWSYGQDPYASLVGRWQTGDRVLFWQETPVKSEAPPGGYWLEAGFYTIAPQGLVPLTVYEGVQAVGSAVRIGPLKVAGPSPALALGFPRAEFAEMIGLLGWRIEEERVTFIWKVTRQPDADYTVFVHALDAQGDIVAQHDGPPRGGSYPTTLWDPGEVVEDTHALVGDLTAAVQLQVGFYSRESLQRLPVEGETSVADSFQISLR